MIFFSETITVDLSSKTPSPRLCPTSAANTHRRRSNAQRRHSANKITINEDKDQQTKRKQNQQQSSKQQKNKQRNCSNSQNNSSNIGKVHPTAIEMQSAGFTVPASVVAGGNASVSGQNPSGSKSYSSSYKVLTFEQFSKLDNLMNSDIEIHGQGTFPNIKVGSFEF